MVGRGRGLSFALLLGINDVETGSLLSFPFTLLPYFFLAWVGRGGTQFTATTNVPSQLCAFVKWFPLFGCPFHVSLSWEMLFPIFAQMLTPTRHRAFIGPSLPPHKRDPLPPSCSPRAVTACSALLFQWQCLGLSTPPTPPTFPLQVTVCEPHGAIQCVSHISG